MTRIDLAKSSASWGTKSSAATDDGNPIDLASQDRRPRGRIRRSMTACHTCRKLKTRCDLDPRGHACRRCLSLRCVFCIYGAFWLRYTGEQLCPASIPRSSGKGTDCSADSSVNCQKRKIVSKIILQHGQTRMRPCPHLRSGSTLWNAAWAR